jgi:hypothetical protein
VPNGEAIGLGFGGVERVEERLRLKLGPWGEGTEIGIKVFVLESDTKKLESKEVKSNVGK